MILQVPRTFSAFGLAALLLGFGLCARAQDKPDRPPWAQPSGPPGAIVPAPTEPASPNVQGSQTPKGTIKVNVSLVNVLVSVLDEQKRPAPNLPKEAFQVFEEGAPQKIEFFEAETKWPLDIALMIDASLSTHLDMQYERAAASHFIQQVLRPGDRMAVFSFDESVTQRSTFTDKVQALQDAVAKIPDGAGTSIYDAILLGSQALGRRGDE